jgi:uncharacterized protein (TIGR02452 family)
MNRDARVQLAQETVAIVARGNYTAASGRVVNIAQAVNACLAATTLFEPKELERLRREIVAGPPGALATNVEVVNETTLAGVARLWTERPEPVAVLNFASAKNPGGGFLNGSQAQEESLARSSALHASLLKARDYYDRHRASPSLLYSDAMILSPGCPIIRDDAGNLLDEPQLVGFITSAAPNAGAAARSRRQELPAIPEVFRRRSEYVLALATAQGYQRLVLGAWGCGVFRNDPALVASVFAGHLRGDWAGRFEQVTFSVWDTSASRSTFKAFQDAFASPK